MMTVTGILMTYIIGLEVAQSLVRFVPSMETLEEKKMHLSTAFWFYITSFTLFVIISFLFKDQLSELVFDASVNVFVFEIGIISIATNAIYFFLQSVLRLNRNVKSSIILNLLYVICTSGLAIYFILFRKMGVIGNFYASIGGSLIGILIFVIINSHISFQFNARILRKLLKFSIPLIPASIAVYITFYVDRIFIKEFLSIADLGVYGIAMRFASVTNILIGGFMTALGPVIYEKFADKETPQQLGKVFYLFLMSVTLLIIATALFSKELVMFITTPDYYASFQYISILAFNIVIYNLYIFMPGLSIAKKTYYIAVIAIISAVINLVLNYLLISIYGTWGSILATTIASLTSQSLTFYFSNKYYKISIATRQSVLLILFSLIIALTFPMLEIWKGYFIDWYWVFIKAVILISAAFYFFFMAKKYRLNAILKESEN